MHKILSVFSDFLIAPLTNSSMELKIEWILQCQHLYQVKKEVFVSLQELNERVYEWQMVNDPALVPCGNSAPWSNEQTDWK